MVTAVKTKMALFCVSAMIASSFCSMDRSWNSCIGDVSNIAWKSTYIFLRDLTVFKDSRKSAPSRLHWALDSSIMCSAKAILSEGVSPSALSGGLSGTSLLCSSGKLSQSFLSLLKKSSFLEKIPSRTVSSSRQMRYALTRLIVSFRCHLSYLRSF